MYQFILRQKIIKQKQYLQSHLYIFFNDLSIKQKT